MSPPPVPRPRRVRACPFSLPPVPKNWTAVRAPVWQIAAGDRRRELRGSSWFAGFVRGEGCQYRRGQ